MSNDDSLEVRQENEIQALKAIFNEDLRDLRNVKPWKTWKPLDIVLQLSPLQGSTGLQEIHAQVDLHIICSENYPNVEPQILLEKSRGVSDVLLKELKEQLEVKATELKGEVMVFELAQHVQAFLHEHNKPSYKSFYEEMLSRQQEQQQLKEQAKQLEEDRERQVMQTEIHRRQEILRSEIKYRRDYSLSTSNDSQEISPNNKKNSRKSISSTSEYSEESLCEHKGTELIIFETNIERKVQKGKCLSHSDRGCVIYSGLDLNSGEIYAITEWKVNTKDHCYNLKQVHSSEQEFTYLSKLKNYNLVRYLAMKYVHVKDEIIIYILQEFVLGANCNAIFIKENVPADVDMLRYIACGVLSALDFLHRNNVVHKELRDSCIFFDNNGIIKVSGYSLEVKLWELASQTQNTEYYSKKTDIYKFGLFMLSLLKGSDTDTAEISSSLPQDLFDFLSKCLSKDEKSRYNASQLLQHQFVRTPLQRMSPQRTYKEILPQVISSGQQSTTDLKFLSQNRSGGPSRIQNEFEVLQWLGKGAFGDVLKVRNKLDGGYYAIKRIELNPKNKQLNRKITREVKLLSRLNHENVVRYYNSWIESAVLEPEQSCSSTESSIDVPKRHVIKKDELSFGNDIELLAPPIKDVEWSISYESKSKHNVENSAQSSSDDESSDDDDDDDDWVNFLPNNADSSDSIEFERSTNNANESDTISDINETKPSNCSSRLTREIQFMYIQMEFCEKSTLRTAIDDGLYSDMDRVWRLFREIVEGLAHIHQQGMIHRDLKPVNIFLDLNDHVKIGDFGLATTNILPRPTTITTTDTLNRSIIESEKEMSQSQDADGSMTGHIGTALYVAPELNATSKAIYNQKVDIYSLGIILFEMCYSGLNTGMERIKVLSNMRLKEIIYPQDFLDQKYCKQRTLISWLLNHDVNQRPTSQELLQSEYIPPPILEECELRELVRHTLSNPQSKTYKYLVASCFEQELNYVDDITYYMSLTPIPNRLLQLHEYVKDAVVKIFKLHGGQSLSTPLLLPKNNYYEGVDSCVKLMTHSGSVVSIPHDLRVPFARYVAWNGITLLKRYSIGRVYREKKVFGYHPRELCECAFDIVTPTPGTLLADAELLSIVSEIVNEFPDLKNKNFIIRLNHTMLLKAVLLHCGIPSEKHNDIYSILSEARDGKVTKFQIRTHLISLCLTDNAMVTLFSLIETETSINKVANTLRMITKRKGEASQLAKQGLCELSQIIQNAEALGIKYTINVALGLVYNVQQYSGMMCQFVCELKKKRRRGGLDVLAAGGRYDCMLENQRLIMERSGMTSRGVSQSAVGISISLDKFIQALQEEQSHEIEGLCNLDVIVCSLGTRPMPKEKAKILKELWAVGIKCNVLEAQTLEEIQEQCTELHVPHIVILKDTEQGIVRVRSWEKDRFQERKINLNELVEFMQKLIKSWNEGASETSYYNMSTGVSRIESRSSINEHANMNYTTAVIVNFVTSPTGKLAANTRKRLENQILSHMESTIQRFSTREQIVVLALNVESSVIKSLSSYLDLESDESVQKSINFVIERHPRHKKYLVQISDEILDYLSCKTRPIISLYSLPDSMFKMLL